MRLCISSLLLALLAAGTSAEGGSLSLVCSGTVKSIAVEKQGTVGDYETDSVEDFSLLVDFDQRAVSGVLTVLLFP